ncbi:hypothetical protein GYMLUDRAFT_563363 [Collybiopsis luxurians FD-317 M1]|uniref:Uncharacterized protein n=1 Tax=Collybiopsis luxurians FD-317 M1 TaxID=944289 RepID=A0A0D0BE99_9AGAR|nr:hypothetical protein GYMLUDRAFT_563363 [Collybiopsis luxurians FD-317 M1]
MNFGYANHQSASFSGPSKVHGPFDDGKKERRRKDLSGKVGKEISDRREDSRHYNESIAALINTSVDLSRKPDSVSIYNLRLLPISLERSALLYQYELEEAYGLERAQTAYDEERLRVEDEWKKGRDRVRERLMEGIEERRRRAREDKEGEGTSADATLDSQSRPHITRKLRNKIGTSPPPTPGAPGSGTFPNATPGAISSLPITSGPFLNPHSLSVDEIPSPFPLPLTSTVIPTGSGGASGTAGTTSTGGRRKPKGSGTHQSQAIGGLGKSLAMLSSSRETEIEADLGEIRRGNKRRRAAVVGSAK